MRWRNGLGWTTELCAGPASSSWHWRLSAAESDGPARFSTFPGIDRELLLVDGAGLRLSSADQAPVTLRSGRSHRFAGEEAVEGIPLDGPTRQLNVMWRRARFSAGLSVHDNASELVVPLGRPATVHVFHVLRGAVHVQAGAESVNLRPSETLVVSALLDVPLECCRVRLTQPGSLAIVRLDPAVDSGAVHGPDRS